MGYRMLHTTRFGSRSSVHIVHSKMANFGSNMNKPSHWFFFFLPTFFFNPTFRFVHICPF